MDRSFPILEFDEDDSAMLEPSSNIRPCEAMPERCVICFFQDVIDHLSAAGELTEIACLRSEIGRNPVYLLKSDQPPVALVHPGVGASLAAGFLEEVIALGGRKFVACGGAGTLDATHEVGRLIVPNSAIRDEGTSYHYLPPDREVAPTAAALAAVKTTLAQHQIPFESTKTWTTDAIYRETRGKIQRRRQDGCGCVEMEAAALFAVARFRNVELAQILYAGDDLSGEFWDSRDWNNRWDVREKLVSLSALACQRI